MDPISPSPDFFFEDLVGSTKWTADDKTGVSLGTICGGSLVDSAWLTTIGCSLVAAAISPLFDTHEPIRVLFGRQRIADLMSKQEFNRNGTSGSFERFAQRTFIPSLDVEPVHSFCIDLNRIVNPF